MLPNIDTSLADDPVLEAFMAETRQRAQAQGIFCAMAAARHLPQGLHVRSRAYAPPRVEVETALVAVLQCLSSLDRMRQQATEALARSVMPNDVPREENLN